MRAIINGARASVFDSFKDSDIAITFPSPNGEAHRGDNPFVACVSLVKGTRTLFTVGGEMGTVSRHETHQYNRDVINLMYKERHLRRCAELTREWFRYKTEAITLRGTLVTLGLIGCVVLPIVFGMIGEPLRSGWWMLLWLFPPGALLYAGIKRIGTTSSAPAEENTDAEANSDSGEPSVVNSTPNSDDSDAPKRTWVRKKIDTVRRTPRRRRSPVVSTPLPTAPPRRPGSPPPFDPPERSRKMKIYDWFRDHAGLVVTALILAFVVSVLLIPTTSWSVRDCIATGIMLTTFFVGLWAMARAYLRSKPQDNDEDTTTTVIPPVRDTDTDQDTDHSTRNKVLVGSGILTAVIAIGVIGALIGVAASPNKETTVAAAIDQSEVNKLNQQVADLQKQLDEAKRTNPAPAPQTAQPAQATSSAPVALSSNEKAVESALQAQGISPTTLRFGSAVDINWAKTVAPGGTTFGDAIYTPNDVVAFLKSGTPEAKAALASLRENTKATDADLQNPANWTNVQFTTPIQWNGNTFYVNGVAADGGSKVDPAGSVGLYYTGPQTIKLASSEGKLDPQHLYGFRGACANPQLAAPTPPTTVYAPPTGNGTYTPPPAPPAPPVTPPAPPVPPTPPTPPIGGCEDNPSTPEDECNPTPPPPPCEDNPSTPEDDCNPTPPCEDNPSTPEDDCNPEPPCEDNPSTPEDDCNPTPPCEDNPSTPEDDCNPEPEPGKCENQTGEFCGTPDEGGEQQPVQDNNPDHVAPTPGYTPGEAEDLLNEQPHCTTDCDLDSTDGGTVVDGSENGGLAPGAGNEAPAENPDGHENSDHDGTPSTIGNPDLGTAAPEDSSTGHDTVGNDKSDWDSGFDLPGIDSDSAADVASMTESAPAADSSSFSNTFDNDNAAFDADSLGSLSSSTVNAPVDALTGVS